MHRLSTKIAVVLASVTVWGITPPAQAQFKDIAIGLSEAGFNFQGDRNFLSRGSDVTISRRFNGETLDFGAVKLTLQGTPRLQVSTGNLGLNVLDVSLNTAGQPLSYSLVTDTGSQLTTINGSLLVDATAKVNEFGFYDLNLDVSSRQTIIRDGRFLNDTVEEDFDIGPVALRGNVFADMLATATDPIFQAMGADNIFAQFSGAAQFQAKVTAEADRARAKAAAGEALTADEIGYLASLSSMGASLGFAMPDLSFLADADIIASKTSPDATGSDTTNTPIPNQVPEPATLTLLALSATALLRRRNRR